MNHYRYHRINIPRTRAVKLVDTVEFHLKYLKTLYASSMEKAIGVLKNLLLVLKMLDKI